MGIAVGMTSRKSSGSGGGSSVVVIDNLESTSKLAALSANQGYLIDQRLKALEELIKGTSEEPTEEIDTIEELYNYVSGQKNTDTVTNTITNTIDMTSEVVDDTEYNDVF